VIRGIVVAIVVLLIAVPGVAQQQLSEAVRRDLTLLNAKPQEQWTDGDFKEMERLTFAMAREILLSGMTVADRGRVANLRIEAVNLDAGPPAWLDGETIRISTSALADLIFLGFLLGHDLYVDGGDEFPITDSVMTRPLVASKILPLLNPLDLSAFYRMYELVKCPVPMTTCSEPQAAAIVVGVIGFVIAHEMAHRLLGHGLEGSRSVAEELAADSKAWDILMKVSPEVEEDDYFSVEYRVRAAIQAGPRVFLRWLIDRTTARNLKAYYEERLSAISARTTEDVLGTVGAFDRAESLDPIRSVTIRWTERPDELYIDGVSVPAAEIEGKSLSLLSDAHIFARRGSHFAYVRTTAGEPAVLTFRVPVTTGVSAAKLDQLRRERKWFDIILRTATANLRPRSPSAARHLHEALARIGMARAVDPGDAEPRDRQGAEYRRDGAAVLAGWRSERVR
jgi:hypothetical protein